MSKRFFVNINNIITGPFERQALLNMLQDGRLKFTDHVSVDKHTWQSPAGALGLIMPTPESPMENTAGSEIESTPPESSYYTTTVPPADENSCSNSDAAGNSQADDQLPNTFGSILACTAASLGNGGEYYRKLYAAGANALLTAGILAAIGGILLTLLGCLFFSSCYNHPPMGIYIKSTALTILSGGIFWIANSCIRRLFPANSAKVPHRAEADFFAAMHGMLNIGFILLITLAVMFVFNRKLFIININNLVFLLVTALLPVSFLLANILVTLRLNLMVNSTLKAGAATAAAAVIMWLTTPLYLIVQYLIYKLS